MLEGVIFPDVGSFEIKAELLTQDGALSRSRMYNDSPDNQKLKTRLIQMFRELERLCHNSQHLAVQDVERVIENFVFSDLRNTRLFESMQTSIKRQKIEEDYNRLRENFAIAAGIYQQNLSQLKIDNPGIRIGL